MPDSSLEDLVGKETEISEDSEKRLLFIFNPYSGKSQIKNRLMTILDTFIKDGYRVEVHVTQKPGEAAEVLKERAADYDRVIVSGGDGTMNEAVNGIMCWPRQMRPVLGYIPAGTTNDYAKTLKLPRDMGRAAHIAAMNPGIPTDVGCFDKKYFNYVAGFGAFTAVSYSTPHDTKQVLGHQAYIIEGLMRLGDIKPYQVKISYDNEVIEGEFLVGLVTNSVSVAGIQNLTKQDAELGDGEFEVFLIKNPTNPVDMTRLVTDFFQKKVEDCSFLLSFRTSRIVFSFQEPMDWVLDGEFGGSFTEIEVKVENKALDIVRIE